MARGPRRKTATELERAAMAKAIRSAIRLKYSIAADEEINRVLFDKLEEFDNAIASGQGFTLALEEIVSSVQR